MTASTKTLPGALYTAVFSDTDIDATMTTVSSSAQRIHQIDAYNPNGTAVWLRVYISSSDEVGTHDPDMSLMIPASTRVVTSTVKGIRLDSIYVACVTNGGGTSGADAPLNDVTVKITYDGVT